MLYFSSTVSRRTRQKIENNRKETENQKRTGAAKHKTCKRPKYGATSVSPEETDRSHVFSKGTKKGFKEIVTPKSARSAK